MYEIFSLVIASGFCSLMLSAFCSCFTARLDAAKRSERAEKALTQLMPVFGHLNLEQAMKALALNDDSVERASDYVLARSEAELLEALGPNPAMAQAVAKQQEELSAASAASVAAAAVGEPCTFCYSSIF
jgi:hypothetical protein